MDFIRYIVKFTGMFFKTLNTSVQKLTQSFPHLLEGAVLVWYKCSFRLYVTILDFSDETVTTSLNYMLFMFDK